MDTFDLIDGLANLIQFLAIALVVIAICASVYRSCSVGMGAETVVTATVTDKGIKRNGNDDKYLIYTETENGIEVFQITDSWIAGRLDSSDVYAQIKVGKTYEFTTRGSRNHLMSWYPNIYEFKVIQ